LNPPRNPRSKIWRT